MSEPTGTWRVAISLALSLALCGSCTYQEADETVIIQIQGRASPPPPTASSPEPGAGGCKRWQGSSRIARAVDVCYYGAQTTCVAALYGESCQYQS
ncbi:hypothetical protein GGI43DRAFT_403740 [Trichoderma evansii]